MAYTDIDDPTIYFNTKLYTGNGGTQSITGVGFQPDWIWYKARSRVASHGLFDSIRGATKQLYSNNSNAEATYSGITSFDSDGFSLGSDAGGNNSSETYVAWNWKAGGSAPAITYTVKVVSDGGNKYRFDDFGTSAVTLDLQEGGTYTFDGSDSSMASHPIKLSETSNGTHGGGSSYNTGVIYELDGSSVTESAYVSGYSSASSRKLIITVAASAPTLYYYCHYHSGMGGQANTNSTFGSSNFSGSIQSTVSANTTAGFSIVSSTGNGSAGTTVGHGLGKKAQLIIAKNRVTTGGYNFNVYHHKNTSEPATEIIALNETGATSDSAIYWNDTDPTTSVFTLGSSGQSNTNGAAYIAYVFSEVKGYSKFGNYTGNGNADGTFVYTGFKPAFIMYKNTARSISWLIHDNKRLGYNPDNDEQHPDTNAADGSDDRADILSNGFKIRESSNLMNVSGEQVIYMAFAESPFVNSNGVPTNAR